MLSFFWDLASFIVALGILITMYEFGHFQVTRRCGIRAERFSIGPDKTPWRRTDKLGIECVIALIPSGGYIKMLGERVGPVVLEFRHHVFDNKSADQRAAITAAGPVANFTFAIFAYWLVFIIGVPGIRSAVGEIAANSIATKAQVAPGTELKVIDGIEAPDWDAVYLQLINKIGDENTTITVVPFGSDQRRDVKLDLRHWAPEPGKKDSVSSLGIRPRGSQIEPILENVQPDLVASKAGSQVDDRIVKVDGQSLTQWITFVMLARNNPGKPLALGIERQGSPLPLTLISESKPDKGEAISFVGIEPKVIPLLDEYKVVRQCGPLSTIVETMDETWQLMKLTVSMLEKLIIGDMKLNNLGGPISVVKGAGMTAELGVVYYLPFLALISVNSGIISLFPLPVLSGRYLLFLAIEKIKDGPVSERVQDFCHHIDSILLVLLMGPVFFNDFSRL